MKKLNRLKTKQLKKRKLCSECLSVYGIETKGVINYHEYFPHVERLENKNYKKKRIAKKYAISGFGVCSFKKDKQDDDFLVCEQCLKDIQEERYSQYGCSHKIW